MSDNPQLRHWCFTVWPKHLGLDDQCSDDEIIDAFIAEWKRLQKDVSPHLNWANAQVERSPDTGRLHIQGYSEWKNSKRRNEASKLLNGHLEPRLGSREDARDYCCKKTWKGKDKGQVLVFTHIGQWRSAKPSKAASPKQRALQMLKAGLTPADILAADIDVYFTHYRSIEATYNLMYRAGITISTEEE